MMSIENKDGQRFVGSPGYESSPSWGKIYKRQVTSELIDLDNNHMGYLGFVRIFEEAQRVLQAEAGLTNPKILNQFGVRLFVRALNIEYAGEATIGDELRVFTKVLMPGKTSFSYHQALYGKDDRLLATSTFTLVCVGEDRKAVNIPEGLFPKLTTL